MKENRGSASEAGLKDEECALTSHSGLDVKGLFRVETLAKAAALVALSVCAAQELSRVPTLQNSP